MPSSQHETDGAAQPTDVLVLWTHWEWRCEWTIDGALRLFHHGERYACELVYDVAAAKSLAGLWLAAIRNLTAGPGGPSIP